MQAIAEVEAFAVMPDNLKFVASQFRRLHGKDIQHIFRQDLKPCCVWNSSLDFPEVLQNTIELSKFNILMIIIQPTILYQVQIVFNGQPNTWYNPPTITRSNSIGWGGVGFGFDPVLSKKLFTF